MSNGRVLSEEERIESMRRLTDEAESLDNNDVWAARYADDVSTLLNLMDQSDKMIADLEFDVDYWKGIAQECNPTIQELQQQNALMLEALETYVRECHDCKDGYIDGLQCGHCWIARDTLAKVEELWSDEV